MNEANRKEIHNKRIKETDWQKIEENYQKMKDSLKPGDYCRIIDQTTNEITFGKIVYENEYWREVQLDTDFRIFSFHNYKFVRSYE